MLIKLLLFILLLNGINPSAPQNIRVDIGTYYDYLVVETSDGNEWLLEEIEEESQIEKVPFTEGDRFLCIFDTMGTDEIEDDVLLYMEYID
jgi:hypothetical protein